MNIMGAMLVSLWASGWVVAAVRVGWQGRAAATAKAIASK